MFGIGKDQMNTNIIEISIGVILFCGWSWFMLYIGIQLGRNRQEEEDKRDLYNRLQKEANLRSRQANTQQSRLHPVAHPRTTSAVVKPSARDRTGLEDKNQ
jgi:hypothetical protein